MSTRPQWWGRSKDHGWVVLDRDIPCNTPGVRGELLFLRCSDEKIFFLKWELWKLPSYQYAINYVNGLAGAAADEARLELERLMSRWPEMQLAIQHQYKEIQDREQAARTAEKTAERKRKKEAASNEAEVGSEQRATNPKLKLVTPEEE